MQILTGRHVPLMSLGLLAIITFSTGISVLNNAKHSIDTTGLTQSQQPRSRLLPPLPISFEPNQGQSDSQVDFIARSKGYNLLLSPTEAVINLAKSEILNTDSQRLADFATQIRLSFLGANQKAKGHGIKLLPGKHHYLIGKNSNQWRNNVPSYAKIKYANIYPGIDLVYYGNEGKLEYDFVVSPGADPNAITLDFQGMDKLEISSNGDLLIHTPLGILRQHKPFLYQESLDGNKSVDGNYVIDQGHLAHFQVAAYDTNKPLIIDPVLSISSYLGGEFLDTSRSLAVDSLGNIYVTGWTFSSNLKTTNPAYQASINDNADAFIAKYDSDGKTLQFLTYFGGSGSDFGRRIAVDKEGHIFVAGDASSIDLGIQGQAAGKADAFIIELSADGSMLLSSTYFGGSEDDFSQGMAISSTGQIYLVGETFSYDLPTFNAFDQSCGINGACDSDVLGKNLKTDAFMAVFSVNNNMMTLDYSTFLGGSETDTAQSVAIGNNGIAYVTGETNSTDFPHKEAFQDASAGGFDGGYDAFVAKIDPQKQGDASLVYATYLGGNGEDSATDIALDSKENVILSGHTSSDNFPVTDTAYQKELNNGDMNSVGDSDAFVIKLDTTTTGSTALQYSTYLGGSGNDYAYGIDTDQQGNVYVAGTTDSINFPTLNGLQNVLGGETDAFVTKLNASDNSLAYSTYFGGEKDEVAYALNTDNNNYTYLVGETQSSNLKQVSSFQNDFGGGVDAFIAKLDNSKNASNENDSNQNADNSHPISSSENQPASGGGGGALNIFLLVLGILGFKRKYFV